MTMGERIKRLRKENGMTQIALAKVLRVTKGTVSTWETNSRVPSIETLCTMSDMFQRSIDYIVGHSDNDTPIARAETEEQTSAIFKNESGLTEYALKYARLDTYGKEAVEAIIRTEYKRCREENTLAAARTYSGHILVHKEA